MSEHNFKVGDLIKYNQPGYHLRSGASGYPFAIVVQEQPLVAVSEEADMRWQSTLKPEYMVKIGIASKKQLKTAITRLD